MRVMLVISYDGSKFYGFQRQNNQLSVQGYLEELLTHELNENIVIKGSGRTDRGVHAKYQVVHFETNKDVNNLKDKINKIAQNLHVKKLKVVSDDFHSRYDVKSKTYIYKIDLTKNRNSNYYLPISYKLNIKQMKKAAKLFIGTHDFRNFVAGKREDYVSTVFNVRVFKINNILYLKFIGKGFYRYMVRNLVGALIEIGKGKIDLNVIKDMLDNPDKEKRLTTVSPNGLYLTKIRY